MIIDKEEFERISIYGELRRDIAKRDLGIFRRLVKDNNMKQRQFIISFLLLPLLFSQCNKCHNEQLSTQAFSQDDLKINPYVDRSHVAFIGSMNDTLEYSIERSMTPTAYWENQGTDLMALHNCKGRWYFSEYNTTVLSAKGHNSIWIKLYFVATYIRPSAKLIKFNLNFSDTAIAELRVLLKFDSAVINNYDDYGTSTSQYLEGFLDTIRLGPNVYQNVYKIVDKYYYQDKNNWVDNFYYSISEGVVGFTFKNSEYYYLLR